MAIKPHRHGSPLLTAADFADLSLLEPYAPLRRLLEGATVVGSDKMPHTVVTMNTQVVLHDETTGERRIVRVVFPGEADEAAGSISVLEPRPPSARFAHRSSRPAAPPPRRGYERDGRWSRRGRADTAWHKPD